MHSVMYDIKNTTFLLFTPQTTIHLIYGTVSAVKMLYVGNS